MGFGGFGEELVCISDEDAELDGESVQTRAYSQAGDEAPPEVGVWGFDLGVSKCKPIGTPLYHEATEALVR